MGAHHASLTAIDYVAAVYLLVWIAILVTHIRFRQTLPLTSVAGIAVILALAASTPFVQGLEWTVPLFLAWLALTTVFYFLR